MTTYINLTATTSASIGFDTENEPHYPLAHPLTIKRVTEKALLLTTPTDPKGEWYPKSQLECESSCGIGDVIGRMPSWVIKDRNLEVKVYTQIFETHQDFLNRPDKAINGVSRTYCDQLVKRFRTTNQLTGVYGATYDLFYTDMGNTGCWNCLDIRNCQDCYQCESSTGLIRCVELHDSTDCTDCVNSVNQHNCYLTYDCQGSTGVSKATMLHNYAHGGGASSSPEQMAEHLAGGKELFATLHADSFPNAIEYMHNSHIERSGATATQWGWVDTLHSNYSSANEAFYPMPCPVGGYPTVPPLVYIA